MVLDLDITRFGRSYANGEIHIYGRRHVVHSAISSPENRSLPPSHVEVCLICLNITQLYCCLWLCCAACAQNCKSCTIFGPGKCDICKDGYGFNSAHTSCLRKSNHILIALFVFNTRSSATWKSTARPSCLVGVLYDIYRETNNRSTANQPLVRNWPLNLPNSAN